jgi:hypothetical protein
MWTLPVYVRFLSEATNGRKLSPGNPQNHRNMKYRFLVFTALCAGALFTGVAAATNVEEGARPVTQAQLAALEARIAELEKQLAAAKAQAASTPVTSAAPVTAAPASVTDEKLAAVTARVEKLENPTGIKLGALSIKPYGYIKLDATYDSQKPSPSTGDFSLFVQPEVGGKSDSQLDFSARDSRFGLDFTLPEEHGITATAKAEIDFVINGSESAYSVRLRHSYVNLAFGEGWSVLAGHSWDAFFYVAPVTLDAGFLGDAGYLYSRRAQLRLSKLADLGGGSKLTARVAVAKTASGDLDGLGQDDGLDSARPTVEALLALDTPLLSSKPTKISIGGEFGTETVDAAGNPDAKNYDSRLLVAGLFLPLTEKIALQGNLWTGENLDGWLGGIGQGVNTTLGTSVAAKGGWAQVVLNPTARWNVNLGYGVDDPDDADLNAGGRAKNTRLFFNAFYKLTKTVTLAAEYSVIKTDYKGAADATDNRVQFTTHYQF